MYIAHLTSLKVELELVSVFTDKVENIEAKAEVNRKENENIKEKLA